MLDYDIHLHRHNLGTNDIHLDPHQGHMTEDWSHKFPLRYRHLIHHHRYQRPRNQCRGCGIPANPKGRLSLCQ